MTHDTGQALVPTRSLLRRIGLGGAMRKRNLVRRWLIVSAGLGTIALTIWATRMRRFDPHGPGAALYWAHDALYLPLKGYLWTALFPYSLLWAVPAVLVAALAVAELLFAGNAVRAAHRATIRFLVPTAPGRAIVRVGTPHRRRQPIQWSDGEGQAGRRPSVSRLGFAERVVAEMHEDLLQQAANHVATWSTEGQFSPSGPLDKQLVRNLIGLADLRISLAGLRPEPLTALIQTLALCGLDEEGRALARDRFEEILSPPARDDGAAKQAQGAEAAALPFTGTDPDWRMHELFGDALSRLVMEADPTPEAAFALGTHVLSVSSVIDEATDPDVALPSPEVALAATYLGAVQPAVRARLPSGGGHRIAELRELLRIWHADRLYGTPAQQAALGGAETLVSFELWSYLAERASASHPHSEMLTEILTQPEPQSRLGARWAFDGGAS